MGILFQDKKIGLALLCDNAPYTLAMTLASYERTGLLDYLDAACVVYPEGGGKVEHTARVCGIPAVPSSMEGGFVGALATASLHWTRITCCWRRTTAWYGNICAGKRWKSN